MNFDTRIFEPGRYRINYRAKPFIFIFCQHPEHINNTGSSTSQKYVFSGWAR